MIVAKNIGEASSDVFLLDVFECECGFHVGLDATYLEQVGQINMDCPACHEVIHIEEYK